MFKYKTDKELWKAWSNLTDQVEAGPQIGDIIIHENGWFKLSLVTNVPDSVGAPTLQLIDQGIESLQIARARAELQFTVTDHHGNKDGNLWLRKEETGGYLLLERDSGTARGRQQSALRRVL
jgi:hypothetical protein